MAHRTHVKKNEYDFLAKVHLILSSPGWKGITNDKISLEDDGFNIYISIDEVSVEKPVPKGNILRNNVPQYDSPLIFWRNSLPFSIGYSVLSIREDILLFWCCLCFLLLPM